jgi:hypothetical protein
MVDFIEKTFNIIQVIIMILYGIIFFGLWHSAPRYLNKFILIFNLFISCVLIILFNPLSDFKFKPIHKQIAFSAGVAILMHSSLVNIITPLELITKVKKKVRFAM